MQAIIDVVKLGKKKEKIRRGKGERICMIVAFLLFLIYSVTLLFPFAWCLLNTFKTRQEFIFNLWGFAKKPTLSNWADCLQLTYNNVNVIGMFGNSIFFALACTLISVWFSSCTAYALAKYKFPMRNFMYTFAFVLTLVPAVGAMAANYKLYNDLGLYDRYIGFLIGSCSGFGTGFFYLYAFFKNLPWSYAEAAQLDGAGHFTIFTRIMIPMALPGVSSIAIMNILGVWNDYFTFYMYAPSKVTIAVGLNGLVELNRYGKVSYPQLFAVMLFSVIPVIILYALTQKLITKNMTLGGVKG